MAKQSPAVSLSSHLEKLVADRQHHADAIAKIDETLAKVGAALSGVAGRPAAHTATAAVATPVPPRGKGAPRRRGRKAYGVTAEQFVLDFVGSNNNPTTKDINNAWSGNGRSGSADNTLSKAVREGKLKRTSLEGKRGSTYVVA